MANREARAWFCAVPALCSEPSSVNVLFRNSSIGSMDGVGAVDEVGGTVCGDDVGALVVFGEVVLGAVEEGSTVGVTDLVGSGIGGSVAGASVAGGTVPGASVTGGAVPGAGVAGGSVAGGSVSGGTVPGGSVSGMLVPGVTEGAGVIGVGCVGDAVPSIVGEK